jgi:hypothetical protein
MLAYPFLPDPCRMASWLLSRTPILSDTRGGRLTEANVLTPAPQLPVTRPAMDDSAGGRRATPLLLAAGVLAVLPVWIPAFPAMCDAPQLASQVAIYTHLGDPAFRFASLFVAHTQMPNLAGYGLLLLLTPWLGAVAAYKLAACMALVALLVSWGWLIAELGGDARWALLAIPGMFGFAFQWGLLGFLCSAPLGVLFLVAALRCFRRLGARRALGLSLLLALLIACHAMIAGYFALLAALCALAGRPTARQLAARWLPLGLTLAGGGAWWLHSIAGRVHSHRPWEWKLGWDRVPDLFVNVAGWPDEAVSAAVVVLLLAPLPLLLGVRRSWLLAAPAGLALGVACFVPHSLMGVDAAYQRFAIFVLPSLALLLRPAAEPRRARLAVAWMLGFALLWTAALGWRMTVFEREARGFQTLLRQMQPGQRILSLSFIRRSPVFAGDVFLHHAVWYAALRGGIADPSFACGNVDLVLYRELPAVRFADFEFHPQRFDWQRDRGELYRYFVVHSEAEVGAQLMAGSAQAVRLAAHDGHWWLYENAVERP